MIKVRVSANERISGRTDFVREALSYFRKGEFDDVIEEDIPCDLIFEESGRTFSVEIKTLKDFHASLNTDRFCSQLLSFVEAGQPCAIAVFGSYKDVIANIPDFDYHGRKSQKKISMMKGMVDDIICECYGMYIPIIFLETNPVTSFLLLSKISMKVLRGGCAANMIPKPDRSVRQVAILCLIKGVGEKTATAIIREFGSIANLVEDIKNGAKRLTKIKVGRRTINPDTAKNISQAFF